MRKRDDQNKTLIKKKKKLFRLLLNMTRHVRKHLKVQFDGVNLKFNFALAANFRHSPGLTGMTC